MPRLESKCYVQDEEIGIGDWVLALAVPSLRQSLAEQTWQWHAARIDHVEQLDSELRCYHGHHWNNGTYGGRGGFGIFEPLYKVKDQMTIDQLEALFDRDVGRGTLKINHI